MPEIAFKFNTREAERVLKGFKSKGHIGIARALNRAGKTVQTFMARAVAEDAGVKVGDAKKAIEIRPATETKHIVRLVIRGSRIPLIAFRARGPEPSRGKGRGVTAKLKGGAGRYPHAFIATTKSGHRGVFQRTGKARLPIVELHGPSLVKVFGKHAAAGVEAGKAALEKNLQHEVDWLVRSASA